MSKTTKTIARAAVVALLAAGTLAPALSASANDGRTWAAPKHLKAAPKHL